MTGRLDASGARAAGCELTLTIPVPPGTEGPPATVECTVTVGNPSEAPALTLSAGLSASAGPTATVLDTCARSLAAWSAAPLPPLKGDGRAAHGNPGGRRRLVRGTRMVPRP
ncbi:hypothetical protein SNARM312S_08374 [Streptomyces narbonensis]